MQHTRLAVTLAAGMSRTGKTTWCLRYLVSQAGSASIFIFDPGLDLSGHLRLVPQETPEEMEVASGDDGFVVYNHSTMFPGQRERGFEFFARWSYDQAVSMPGRKILFVDEVWKVCTPHAIPQALAEWVQDGAKHHCEVVLATQTPNKLNSSITGEVTELVSFRLQERNALETVQSLGADPDEVRSLPMGCFVSLNVLSGSVLRGRLW